MAGYYIILSISYLYNYFKDNMKQLNNSKIVYKGGHILKLQTDLEQNIIMGKVQHSTKW